MGGLQVRIIQKILDYLDRSIKWFGVFSILLMLLVALMDLFYRDILSLPLSWSLDFVLLVMIWFTMTNSAVGVRESSHIRVEIFVSKFPKFVKDLLEICVNCLIIYYGYMMIGGGVSLSKLPGRMSGLTITYFWMYITVTICGILLIIFCIEKITKIILGWFRK